METKVTYIPLEKLQLNPLNPRRIFNERALVESISTKGLEVPVHVRGFKDRKTFDLLRGDRRTKAMQRIRKEDPEAFDKHFSKGVPCIVHADISEDEAIQITNDHGQTLSLSNEFEIYLTVEGYYRMGMSEFQAIMEVQTLLDHVLPIKGKAGVELAELKQKLDNASKANREERRKAFFDRYKKARRGLMQRYTRIWKNALIVKDAMEFKWLKVMPEGYEQGSTLPILSDDDLRVLSKTYVDEAAEGVFDSSGKPLVTKVNPGAKWTEKWEELIASKAGNGESSDEPRKSISRKEIIKPLNEGLIDSGAMANILRYHSGDKEVDAKCIHAADGDLAIVEVVRKVDKALWEECVSVYKAYLKEQQDKAPEAPEADEADAAE